MEDISNNSANLTAVDVNAYVTAIETVRRSNIDLFSYYASRSRSIAGIRSIKEEDKDNSQLKVAEGLWKGSMTLLSVALGGWPRVIVSALEDVNTAHNNKVSLNVDAQMSCVALESLSEASLINTQVFQNAFQSLQNIRQAYKPCIPKGKITDVDSIHETWTSDTARSSPMVVVEACCSRVEVKIETGCLEGDTYVVAVQYRKPYTSFVLCPLVAKQYEDLVPIRKEVEVEIDGDGYGFVDIPYEILPTSGKLVEWSLWAQSNDAYYLLNRQLDEWAPRHINEDFSDRLGDILNQESYEDLSLQYDEETGQPKQMPLEVIALGSPGELRVFDSQGRVTGLVDGIIKDEIPAAIYDSANSAVVLFTPIDSYSYEVVGTDKGKYELTVISVGEDKVKSFEVANMAISDKAVHEYTIDWDILAEGKEGTIMRIDSDGDGIFERTKYLGQEKEGFPWAWVVVALAAVCILVFYRRRKEAATWFSRMRLIVAEIGL